MPSESRRAVVDLPEGRYTRLCGVGSVTRMSRDPWLDNVKLTLVTLVVIGHSWGLLAASDLDIQLYNFVYYWHIPAFVLVSGHLSRSFVWDRRHASSLFTTLLLPYLIFEPALYYFRHHFGQHEDGPLWLQPHWAMWYLLVLFFWRLATPLLTRHWVVVPISIVVSLVGGMTDELLFCLPRILGLLPFFVIGLHLDRNSLRRVTDPRLRPIAVVVLVWIFWFADQTNEWARSAFLFYDAGYATLGYADVEGMKIRALVMIIGLLGTLSVLVLVPRTGARLTQWGGATLVIYLFHGFFVRYAEFAGWFDFAPDRPVAALALCTSFAVVVALTLGSPPVVRVLTWAVDPVGSWRRHRTRGIRLPNGA